MDPLLLLTLSLEMTAGAEMLLVTIEAEGREDAEPLLPAAAEPLPPTPVGVKLPPFLVPAVVEVGAIGGVTAGVLAGLSLSPFFFFLSAAFG